MRTQFGPTAITLLSLLAVPGVVLAAEPDTSAIIPSCGGKFGLCGYVNKQTRQEVIPARFERAMPFSEGLAAVRVEGSFGYIDERGEIVIEPRFDLAGDFYQGLAEILVRNKTGVINRKGEIVVPPTFRRAIPFTKEIILAAEGTWTSGYYDGFEKLPGLKEGTFDIQDSGLYHIDGYWIGRPNLKHVVVFEREGRGLIWATEKDRYLGPFGLLASDGTWVIEPEFEYAAPLSEDRAVVRKRVDNAVVTGAVDPAGQLVIPLEPRALYGWRNGWGLAKESYQGGKEALVDKNGNMIGGRYFDKVEQWDEGDVAAVLIGDRWMGLNRTGTIVPYPRNGRLFASCPNGLRVVEIDGKMQVTDATGQQTARHLFERLVQRPTCDRPFAVQFQGKWSFVGLDGRPLFDPPLFGDVYSFDGGYAFVRQGAKWGIIDTSGNFVLAPKLDRLLERRAGLFRVSLDGREAWMTASGEERPEPAIKYTPSPKILNCGHGLKLIERDGRWGIADADGRDVITPSYRAIVCFHNGIAWAPVDARRQWCALGPDGRLHEKPACRVTHYPYIQTHAYPEKFDDDPFESSVLWSRAYLEFGAGQRDAPPRMIGSRGGYSSTIPY
jgi:bifunctional DNA-binding transcriptional regulator/antitoxin component of YhaV-PrlF toxin-antitoxin module